MFVTLCHVAKGSETDVNNNWPGERTGEMDEKGNKTWVYSWKSLVSGFLTLIQFSRYVIFLRRQLVLWLNKVDIDPAFYAFRCLRTFFQNAYQIVFVKIWRKLYFWKWK